LSDVDIDVPVHVTAVARVPSTKASVSFPVAPVMVKPLNVATPLEIAAVAPALIAPDPEAILAVIVPVAVVTTLPELSSTLITG
jgi:hypothetical protein